MDFPSKEAAEKRRAAFKGGLSVKCGGYKGIVLNVGYVKEGTRVDLNMKPYGKAIYDFSIYVNAEMGNGRMSKQWWLGSKTTIPRSA